MKFVVVFACALICLVSGQVLQPVPTANTKATGRVYTLDEQVFIYNAWKTQYKKSYRPDEESGKFAVWQANLKFVEEWNAQEGKHKVAMNHLADLTREEFSKMLNGFRLPAGHTFDFSEAAKVKEVSIPAAVDWRTKGYVTPVKDQGQCGSCYSFSSTGSIEGAVFKKTGVLTSVSEQQIVDCSGSYGNNGCNGGLMTDCFTYVISGSKGEESEASYPYKAVQGTCEFSAKLIASTISSYASVTAGSETDLTAKSATIGPISVAIDASNQSFQLYSSGVYNEPACSSTALDHGVLVVGYGSDNGDDYYIVKNSWNTTWGQEGYIWMSRNKNNQCGIASMASYPIA